MKYEIPEQSYIAWLSIGFGFCIIFLLGDSLRSWIVAMGIVAVIQIMMVMVEKENPGSWWNLRKNNRSFEK